MPPDHGADTKAGVLIIGCGALVRELRAIAEMNRSEALTVECLPAKLHNRPELIPAETRQRIRSAKARGFKEIIVGYMDCGTGGLLDRVCREEGVQRLPGAHCYELYAGTEAFARLHDAEPGTFYLSDYMVRHFERLIMDGLGISAHPELRDAYFANYTRVLHLAQSDDPRLAAEAERAARRLGLRCERVHTGIGGLARPIIDLTRRPRQARAA